ncbi:MAG: hypothetical protein PHY23_03500 [Oscillospiraceae bacterium]|nr:hypothetical protein [Oscillospiraceae bacterium]
MAKDSYRHIAQPQFINREYVGELLCGSTPYGDKGRKRYPTIIYAIITLLNGDCLTRNAEQSAMCNALVVINFKALPRKMTLNIRYGNGAAVVVRVR